MAAIEVRDVTKRYGDVRKMPGVFRASRDGERSGAVTAVSGLDLTVEEGEVYGFLGPNGAGKSTTIDMLLDFVRPTAGEVRVLGRDAREESVLIRERTGVLPEAFDVYDRLTGRQHVEFAIESKEVHAEPGAILERVGLDGEGDRRAGDYSKGMRQRLALGMALVGEPDLLILDEPSTGLDPNGAREMRTIVREENDRGATVFFSSHILGQVEAVCDRVGILRDGQLVAEDSVEGLREAVGTESTLHITVDSVDPDAVEAVRALAGVTRVDVDGTSVIVGCEDAAKTRVLGTLEDNGSTVVDFETEEASLEELFVAYTEDGGDGSTVTTDAGGGEAGEREVGGRGGSA